MVLPHGNEINIEKLPVLYRARGVGTRAGRCILNAIIQGDTQQYITIQVIWIKVKPIKGNATAVCRIMDIIHLTSAD